MVNVLRLSVLFEFSGDVVCRELCSYRSCTCTIAMTSEVLNRGDGGTLLMRFTR
jgi:hypothetical protein